MCCDLAVRTVRDLLHVQIRRLEVMNNACDVYGLLHECAVHAIMSSGTLAARSIIILMAADMVGQPRLHPLQVDQCLVPPATKSASEPTGTLSTRAIAIH